MLHSLYGKLALILFGLMLLMGLLLVQLIRHSSELYQQEVTQKLNHELAEHIVADQPLMKAGSVNQEGLEHLFHMLMVINPSIELYLLNPAGEILGYAAPAGKVKRDRVELEPIKYFLSAGRRFPLTGDDPRDPNGHKVFSAARIPADGPLSGYLYIVLGGERYDNVVQVLQGSYILRSTVWVLLAAMIVAFVMGLYLFARATRRLGYLTRVMSRYGSGPQDSSGEGRYELDTRGGDEVDRLGLQFNAMADQIDGQLEQLHHMDQVRREMVANISHDLRTPITALQGYLETLLLKHEGLSKQEIADYVQIAMGHSRHLTQLVSELFELAKLESYETVLRCEPFSMGELIQDVVQKYRLGAEKKGIQLHADIPTLAPLVQGDIGLLHRVLENLIDNALRHTPKGGQVCVGVGPQGDGIQVRVSDTGCGIPHQELPRIFERFYRLNKERSDGAGCSGLGLAIAKRILELHGGFIEVDSQLQRGTTFRFSIPAYQG